MKQQIDILKSPISNASLKPYLSCIDYTVSNEIFFILKDESLDFLVTSPRPLDKSLMDYYASEDYISHTDSQKKLLDKVYQIVRKITIKSKIKKIRLAQPKAKDILDVGCGTGTFLEACQKEGFNVFGVEPNKRAFNVVAEKIGSDRLFKNIESFKKTAQKKFDVITLWHVLEHVPNLLDYIETLEELLKPNGVLIIAVPNFKSYDAYFYKEHWAAYDVPRHLWHFSKEAIAKLFERVDLKIKIIHPMFFDAFYVSLLSEKNKKGFLKNLRAIFIGLLSNMLALFSKEYSSLIYVLKHTKTPNKAT